MMMAATIYFPENTLDTNGNINNVSGGYLSADGNSQGSRERFGTPIPPIRTQQATRDE